MITRQQVVAQALTYKDVPWKHQGRSRKGVDCVGLLICVGKDLGLVPPDFEVPPYGREPDGTMLEHFREHCTFVPRHSIKDGTMVVFAYFGSPYHTGIVLNERNRSMIHGLASARKCIVDKIDHRINGRQFVSAWDYKGVTDG